MKNTKLFTLALLLIIVVAMCWKFWDILMLFLTSAVVAYLLSPLTTYIVKRTNVKRGIAVFVVTLLFLMVIVTIISFTVPTLISQVSSLVAELNRLAPKIESTVAEAFTWLDSLNLPPTVIDKATAVFANLDSYIGSFIMSIATGLLGFTTQLLDIVVFVILVIYFMLDSKKLGDKFVSSLPVKLQKKAMDIAKKSDLITWKYLKSKIIISLITSVVSYFGFIIIGVKYAFVFAVLSFILNFIPYFGSLISGALPILVCLLTGNWGKALAVFIFTLLINQVEGNIISPKIQGDLSGIHPITVMFAILACNKIWGPMGMMIAVPVAAVIKMCLQELYFYVISDLN